MDEQQIVYVAESKYSLDEVHLIAICSTLELAKEAVRQYSLEPGSEAMWQDWQQLDDAWVSGEYIVYSWPIDMMPVDNRVDAD